MSLAPKIGLLPVLVADLLDAGAREFLESVAQANGVAFVPLLAAPVDTTPHRLEVYTPGCTSPLVLIAEPCGPPRKQGFPMKLQATRPAATPSQQPPSESRLRPRRETTHRLSQRHTRDLLGPEEEEVGGDDLIGRTILGGKLQLETFVGRGGMGSVYKAQHRELRIPMAVKVLHEAYQRDVEFCRRFHAEALSSSRLDHPNLTRVLDFGQEPDGLLYIAMEFLAGTSLREVLEVDKTLEPKRIVPVMMQVCAALFHAHSRGIIHRDIKPENIVLVPGTNDDGDDIEVVKVCDFGIALGGPADVGMRIAGTPEYMSPEQCAGAKLDARSDVYAVGVVLYELMTGRLPFHGDDPLMIIEQHRTREPVPPSAVAPGIDPALERITLKALAKDPDARYATMRDLRADLRALLDEVPRELRTGAAKKHAAPAPPTTASDPAPPPGTLGVTATPDRAFSPVGAIPSAPAAFLGALTTTSDPVRFRELARALESPIRKLAETRDVAALSLVVSAFESIATAGVQSPGSRAETAASMLRLLADPQVLGSIAEMVLVPDAPEEAVALIARAGLGGAYALYSARVKMLDPEARDRFVGALREIGVPALPLIRAALERLESRTAVDAAVDLAEDLLLAMPPVHDEPTGQVVARYARSPKPGLAAAATATLPHLWGVRAHALLLGLLEYPAEEVRLAAMTALREIGTVDEHVVRKLDPIVRGAVPTVLSLRVAALTALRDAMPSARREASAMLLDAFLAPDQDPEMTFELAKALLKMGGRPARTLVLERSESCTPVLRERLVALVEAKKTARSG